MQRINLSVDLSENEILPNEIKKSIQQSVESVARAKLQEYIDDEILEKINGRIKAWQDTSSWSLFNKRITKDVDNAVESNIKQIIKELHIENKVNIKLSKYIDDALCEIDFKSYIKKLVEDEVKNNIGNLFSKLNN